MVEITSPQKTFAIVVGIEKYGKGIAELDGPANDALRFIEWLRGLDVPSANITTHIVSTDRNAFDCARQLERAGIPVQNQHGGECSAIRQSLLNAPGQIDGDLLFLFWGGHGMYSYKEKQALLFGAEANGGDYIGIGADDILDFMRERKYGGHSYRNRIVFIDACADEQATKNLETKYPLQDGFFTRGVSMADIRVASFQSAALGQVALQENANAKRTGVFSNLLLGWLSLDENRRFPPKVSDLIEFIKLEFESRGINQRPVFLKLGNWGDKPENVIHDLLDRERMRRLQTAHQALGQLVSVDLTTAELKRFYEATLSDESREHSAEDVDRMLGVLSEKTPRDGIKIDREVELIWRISDDRQIKQLSDWVIRRVTPQSLADLKEFIEQEKLQTKEHINYLLVDIPAGHMAAEKKITYWFYSDRPVPEHGSFEYPDSDEKVREVILDLISQKENHPHGRLFVELYVAFDWLNRGIEQWECLSLLDDAPHLGETHPVVVRWRERAQCSDAKTNFGLWIARAGKIRDKKYCPQCQIHWFKSPTDKPREIMTWLVNNNYGSFVSFTCTPPTDSIRGMLVGGVPFAFWRRMEISDWAKFETLLDGIAIRSQLDDLPHSIRQLRDESKRQDDHHGTALTLLWDDPNRNPLGEMLSNNGLAKL